MANIFEIADYSGVKVILGEREWKRKILSRAPTGHPEVADYLGEIKEAIFNPDIVFESTRRIDTRIFYGLNAGRGIYKGKHLVIVVKYVKGNQELRGYVSTVYLARGLYSRGRILWQRENLLTD